jgi:hypothetical protein
MPARSRLARPAITIYCTLKAAGSSRAKEEFVPAWEAALERGPAQKQQLLCAQASRQRKQSGASRC